MNEEMNNAIENVVENITDNISEVNEVATTDVSAPTSNGYSALVVAGAAVGGALVGHFGPKVVKGAAKGIRWAWSKVRPKKKDETVVDSTAKEVVPDGDVVIEKVNLDGCDAEENEN